MKANNDMKEFWIGFLLSFAFMVVMITIFFLLRISFPQLSDNYIFLLPIIYAIGYFTITHRKTKKKQ